MRDQRSVDRDRVSAQRFIGAILFAIGTGLAFGLFGTAIIGSFSFEGAFIGGVIGLLIYGGLWLLIDEPTRRD